MIEDTVIVSFPPHSKEVLFRVSEIVLRSGELSKEDEEDFCGIMRKVFGSDYYVDKKKNDKSNGNGAERIMGG